MNWSDLAHHGYGLSGEGGNKTQVFVLSSEIWWLAWRWDLSPIDKHFMSRGSILPPFAPVPESVSLIHYFYNKGLFYNEKRTISQPRDDMCYRSLRIRK